MGTSLAEALAPLLPKVERRWQYARTATRPNMTWEHPEMGEFVIGIEHGDRMGQTESREGFSWAQIGVGGKMPGKFRIIFASNLLDSVHLVLQARGNDVVQSDGHIPPLDVNVEWEDGRPMTRVRDKDNLDHFLVNGECVVMQLQTSLVTRGGSFYVCNHELWATQIVEITEDSPTYVVHEVDGKRYAAVNLWDTQAYPGADFLFTNKVTGPKVIDAMLKQGLKPPVVETRPEIDWDPPAFPQENGYEGAIVRWFNPNIGAQVLTESGEIKFIPLKGVRDSQGRNIMKRGGFPIVTPKQQVLLRMVEGDLATVRPID